MKNSFFKQDTILCLVDIPIQIPNGTHQVIIQVSDKNTIWLVIATIVLAIGTCAIAWITYNGNKESNRLTRESNDLLKLEIKNKIRPDLQVVNFSPEPLGESKTVKYYPNIVNYGTVSAHSIRIYINSFRKVDDLTDIIKDENEIKRSVFMPYGSLLPTKPLRFNSPVEYPLDGIERRIIVWIEYEFLENNHDEVIFNIGLKNEQYLDHVYYSNSDIIKAREKWRKFKAGETSALI